MFFKMILVFVGDLFAFSTDVAGDRAGLGAATEQDDCKPGAHGQNLPASSAENMSW